MSLFRRVLSLFVAVLTVLGLAGLVAAPSAHADTGPGITIGDVAVTRPTTGTATLAFPVRLTQTSKNVITVNYATADNSAHANTDYVPVSGSLYFAPGNVTKTISVTVKANTLDTGNESLRVDLSSPTNAGLQRGSAYGTLIDNAPNPYLNLGDTTVTAGAGQTGTATVTASLSYASANTVSVHYATRNGTARAGYNFTATSGTLTFAPGTTTKTITVPILGGTGFESASPFFLDLSSATNATIGDGTSKITILDNDVTPYVTVDNVDVTKPSSGTTNAVFTVRLTQPATQSVSLDYDTSNGSAVDGTDFTGAHGTLTFPAGTTAQTVSVPVIGNTANNAARYFYLGVSDERGGLQATRASADAYILSPAQGQAFLNVKDVGVTRAGSATSVTETVTLFPAQSSAVSVNYSTQDGNAVQPTDYTTTSGTLTFPAGATSETVTVPIPGTTLLRGDRSFYFNISNPPAGISIDRSQGYTNVFTAQPTPYLTVTGSDVVKPTSGTVSLPYTVTLNASPQNQVTVNYATQDGSAVSGTDYTATSGTLTFAAGTTTLTQTVNVPVKPSTVTGSNKYFYFNLSAPVNSAISNDSSQTFGYILNHNTQPIITVEDSAVYRPTTGSAQILFPIDLSAASPNPVTFNYYTGDGSAVSGTDYTGIGTTAVTIPAGQTRVYAQVQVLSSAVEKATNYFYLYINSATNATISQSYGTGSIVDEQVTPYLSVNNPTVTTSATAGTNEVFTVTLSGPSGGTVKVNYHTGNGSAADGTDYTGTSGTLSFSPGTVTQTVSVPVLAEPAQTSDRYFYLYIDTPVNAAVSTSYGTGRLLNVNPTPSLTIGDRTVVSTGAATTLTFPVTLTPASTAQVTVNYHTGNGSAADGTDFTGQSGTLTFSPGTTSQNVSVPILASSSTSDRYFYVYIDTPVNAQILYQSYARGDILVSPADTSDLTVTDIVTQASTSATTGTFTIRLTPAATSPVVVRYETDDNGAIAGTDYTATNGSVTFNPGDTSKTVSVPILAQKQATGERDFYLRIYNNTGPSTIQRSYADDMIENVLPDSYVNNGPDVAVVRGNSGSTSVSFTATLSPAQLVPVSVDYTTNTGSAVSPSDYTQEQGTITFAAGQTSATVTVPVNGTTAVSGTEYFYFDLFDPVGTTIGQSRSNAYLYGVNTDTITGTVTDTSGAALAGILVKRSGNSQPVVTTTTAADGSYSFPNSAYGQYTISPASTGYGYGPSSQLALLNGNGNYAVPPFIAFTGTGITGRVTHGSNVSVVGGTVTLSGGGQPTRTVHTNSVGYYAFGNVVSSSTAYVVTATATGYTTSNPTNYTLTISGTTQTGKSFVLS